MAGIPAIASDWWPFAERMTVRRRAIAYDHRGSGHSSVTPGPYTTSQLAADAVALLDFLAVDAGHLFFLEQPDETARALEELLA